MIQTTTSSSFKRFVCLEKTLKKFSNNEELSDFYFYFFVAFFPLFLWYILSLSKCFVCKFQVVVVVVPSERERIKFFRMDKKKKESKNKKSSTKTNDLNHHHWGNQRIWDQKWRLRRRMWFCVISDPVVLFYCFLCFFFFSSRLLNCDFVWHLADFFLLLLLML